MCEDDKPVLLGRITGAHGIRGDVIVQSFTDDPLSIGAYGTLATKDGARSFEISAKRLGSKGVVARIKGIDDRNAAEALKGVELYVSRQQLGDAEDGAFFYADLVGLAVDDPDGIRVGEVVAVENFGAGDLLEVRLTGRKKTEYVAFTHDFVPVVDIEGGRVVVVVPSEAKDDKDRG